MVIKQQASQRIKDEVADQYEYHNGNEHEGGAIEDPEEDISWSPEPIPEDDPPGSDQVLETLPTLGDDGKVTEKFMQNLIP